MRLQIDTENTAGGSSEVGPVGLVSDSTVVDVESLLFFSFHFVYLFHFFCVSLLNHYNHHHHQYHHRRRHHHRQFSPF
jgi:hypothetical protein